MKHSTPTHHHAYRLGFRGDVEGLRAVAILLVVAAHARVEWLAGGFVGVDVFYVLSGYLITGLLLQETANTGTVRLTEFYARRLRRLLPGLLLMLAVVFTIGSLLIGLTEQPNQALAGASAALWLSNFYFAFSRLDYFGAGWDANLFLHTWSLGVEEQFYLVWPVLLAFAARASKGGAAPVDARRLQRWLIGVLVVSLVACLAATPTAPRFAFYMMPTRAWQFALGALVFLHFGAPRIALAGAASAGSQSLGARVVRGSGWPGLALIVAAALFLDENVTYPGAWALLPSIGAAAVLAAGVNSAGTAGRFLSLGPMQSIGRISYAWYLWHWPVLLLGATVMDVRGGTNRFGLVLLSFVLAYLSTRLVEAPIRRAARWIARPGIAVASAAFLMLATAAAAAYWHRDAEHRIAGFGVADQERVRFAMPAIYGMGCDDLLDIEVAACAFGPDDAANTAVAIGDSIGMQWFPAIATTFDAPGWRLVVLTKSACPMVDEPVVYAPLRREFTECAQWRRNVLLHVATLKPAVIILGSSSGYDFTAGEWLEGTARVVEPLSRAARQIYIVRGTPALPFDGPNCLLPRTWLQGLLNDNPQCTAAAHSTVADDVLQSLRQAAARFPNVTVVDMNDAVCPGDECRAERNGIVVFRDKQHLSVAFVESLADVLAARLGLGAGQGPRWPAAEPSAVTPQYTGTSPGSQPPPSAW